MPSVLDDPEASERFAAAFDAGDVGEFRRQFSPLTDDTVFTAPPLLRFLVDRNGGHCHRDAHREIADLLTPETVRAFREDVLADRTDDVRRRLRSTPGLVEAEFAAGRGLARPIHHFVSVPTARVLVEAGADLAVLTTLGESAVTMQMRFGTLEGLRFLLERGADPNRGRGGHMPTASMDAMIALLLEHGWNGDRGELLHDANHGHGGRVRTWLKHGADPNVRTDDGRTALHLLAARGTGRDTIRALVAAGADVNARDDDGRTPLDLARTASRTTAAETLVALGGK